MIISHIGEKQAQVVPTIFTEYYDNSSPDVDHDDRIDSSTSLISATVSIHPSALENYDFVS